MRNLAAKADRIDYWMPAPRSLHDGRRRDRGKRSGQGIGLYGASTGYEDNAEHCA
jgi:hypothetical protein